MSMGAWQPIETAPKNKELLLWVNVAIGRPLVVQGCWYSVSKRDHGWIDTNGVKVPVTHWMPLPDAPAAMPDE